MIFRVLGGATKSIVLRFGHLYSPHVIDMFIESQQLLSFDIVVFVVNSGFTLEMFF